MIKKKTLAILISVYLVSLVILLPARVPLAFLPETIYKSGVKGTLWHGRIQTLRIQKFQVEQLRWDVNLLSFLKLTLDVKLQVGGTKSVTKGMANVLLSPASLKVKNVSLDTQILTLMSGFNADIPFGGADHFNGMLTLLVDEYEYAQPFCSTLSAHLDGRSVDFSNQFGHFPIGNVALDIQCEEGSVLISLDEEDNELGLQARIEIAPDRNFTLLGSIKSDENIPENIRPLLSFLGQPDPQGRYPIEFQGQLP